MQPMTQTLTHEQVHQEWSEKQLERFYRMSLTEQAITAASGALEHWTAETKTAASNFLKGKTRPGQRPSEGSPIKPFELPKKPPPPLATSSRDGDFLFIAAIGGWLLAIAALSGHAFGLY